MFPEHLNEFIFECIDSAEALELLVLLDGLAGEGRSAARLSEDLRLHVNSVTNRLATLTRHGLLAVEDETYYYRPADERRRARVRELCEYYRTHRHRVLEAIFSPGKKKVRDFARAFRVRGDDRKDDDE